MKVVAVKGPHALESVDNTAVDMFQVFGNENIVDGVDDVDYNIFKEEKIID